MITRIGKWGNSIGIRIPAGIARDLDLDIDTEVEIQESNGSVTITPVKREISLDDLVAQISPENLHREIDTGSPVGNEAW
jgi:antitoxin MazE